MTILWKSKTEQIEHFVKLVEARMAIFPHGKITAVQLGKASRQVTDSMGIPNATIPGTARVDAMVVCATKHGLSKPIWRLGKKGQRLSAELVW
jgi:hypothetical protein